MSQLLDTALSGWVLFVTVVGLLLVNEIGYRIGHRHREETLPQGKSQAELLIPALLAILGLLLAFSFTIAQDRFEKRRSLVLDDANAIGTTYLRAKTLPPPYDGRIQALLRAYVSFRIEGRTPQEVQTAIVRSGALHAELWAQAAAVARANPESEVVGRFLESLNRLIDLHEARVTVAFFQRIPGAVLWMLFVVSALSIGTVGYRAGLDRTRAMPTVSVLAFTITAVLALIVELDRPFSRWFSISQRPMQDVARTMSEGSVGDARATQPP